jgi:hypothetical protein
MTPRSLLFFLTVTLPVVSLSSADAVVLCAKKSGEVIVRESFPWTSRCSHSRP